MSTTKHPRLTAATLIMLCTAVGSACSSTATSTAAISPTSGGGSSSGAGGVASTPSGGSVVGGRDARVFTCDSFPAADLLAAVQTVAAATTAGSVKTERLADEFGSPLVCDYLFASNRYPDLPTTAAESQDMTFIIKIEDGSVDGVPTPQTVSDAFSSERDQVSGSVNGDATSDHQILFTRVTGIGDDAFFNDYYTRNAGINEAVASDFSVLRSSLPMSVEVDLDYAVQPGAAADTAAVATDPFQTDTLHSIIEAVTKAILTRVS